MMARSVALVLPRGSRWVARRPKSHGAGGGQRRSRGDVAQAQAQAGERGTGATSGLMDFLRATTGEIGPVLRGMREEDRRLCPYRIWPEEGGLVNWAVTVWGDHCFWLTEGDPARWPVLV